MTLRERIAFATKAAVGIFDDNSIQQAYGLLTGITPGGIGQPPVRGTTEYLRSYSSMPWLRAVSSRIATKVSTTEWSLYVSQPKGAPKAVRDKRIQRLRGTARRKAIQAASNERDMRQLTDHPLLDLLHDPNSFLAGEQTRKVTQLHYDLVGEAFWLKERNGMGVVTGLWPIPPDWIMNLPTPITRTFRVGFRGWRGLIPDTEFIWIVDPDPSNPYGRGSGTAQSLGDELETDAYAARHTKAFFYNGAKPDVLVYPQEGTMREPDVRRLEEDWLSKNQGFWKSFKPYFLSRQVGVHEFDQNFRAMQFVQLREYERDAVIQTYGVPPEILGVLKNSNRATIAAADTLFNRYVVEPRLETFRAVLQERLVPEFDERLILDFVSPVEDDRDLQLDVAQSAIWALTVDEWRKMAGQTPMEDPETGALHALPRGYVFSKVVPMDVQNAPVDAGPAGGQDPEGVDENGDPIGPARPSPGKKPPAQTANPAGNVAPRTPADGDAAPGSKPPPKALSFDPVTGGVLLCGTRLTGPPPATLALCASQEMATLMAHADAGDGPTTVVRMALRPGLVLEGASARAAKDDGARYYRTGQLLVALYPAEDLTPEAAWPT